METCWVGAIREKSCSSYFKSCSFSFPHILGVNQKFGPNSLNCLPNTAWLCAGKRNLLKGWQFGKKKKRSRSDYLLDDFRWASRRLSSKSQQLSCCYMSYFCGSFPNLLFAYTRKILTSSLHLHVRFIQLRGEKKHSWAAQLKQHQPVLPVTRSRNFGGWLACWPMCIPKRIRGKY